MCFYDTCLFNGKPVGLPVRMEQKGALVLHGCFCSCECALAHLKRRSGYLTTVVEQQRVSLLRLYAKQQFGIEFLKAAPPFLLLRKFHPGHTETCETNEDSKETQTHSSGLLTIAQYRAGFAKHHDYEQVSRFPKLEMRSEPIVFRTAREKNSLTNVFDRFVVSNKTIAGENDTECEVLESEGVTVGSSDKVSAKKNDKVVVSGTAKKDDLSDKESKANSAKRSQSSRKKRRNRRHIQNRSNPMGDYFFTKKD
jgi:hypothetical protein